MFEKLKSYFYRNEKKIKRGFTVAETVVAMAVITIVSITAIAIVKRAINHTNKRDLCTEARRDAENCLESFKFSESYNEYISLAPKKNQDSAELVQDPGYYKLKYKYGIVYTMVIDVNYNPVGVSGDTFSVKCYDNRGRVAFQFDYKKG